MLKFLSKIFPSKSEKDVNRILPLVGEINEHFEEYQKLSDEELKAKTVEFRQRIKDRTKDIEDEIAKLKEQLKTDTGLSLEDRENINNRI